MAPITERPVQPPASNFVRLGERAPFRRAGRGLPAGPARSGPLKASRLALFELFVRLSQSFSSGPLRASRPALSELLVRLSQLFSSGPRSQQKCKKARPTLFQPSSWERWAKEVDTNPAYADETGWPPGLPVRGVGKVGVSSTCSNATELRPAVRNVQGTPRPRLRRSRKP